MFGMCANDETPKDPITHLSRRSRAKAEGMTKPEFRSELQSRGYCVGILDFVTRASFGFGWLGVSSLAHIPNMAVSNHHPSLITRCVTGSAHCAWALWFACSTLSFWRISSRRHGRNTRLFRSAGPSSSSECELRRRMPRPLMITIEAYWLGFTMQDSTACFVPVCLRTHSHGRDRAALRMPDLPGCGDCWTEKLCL